jgi:hypothetical protein
VNVLSAKEIYACTVPLVTVGVTVALCSGCGSDDMSSTGGEPARTATVACDAGRAGPPSVESAFVAHLPRGYAVEEICATDVGPGPRACGGCRRVVRLGCWGSHERLLVARRGRRPERPCRHGEVRQRRRIRRRRARRRSHDSGEQNDLPDWVDEDFIFEIIWRLTGLAWGEVADASYRVLSRTA